MKVAISGWISATYYSFYENGKVPYSYDFATVKDKPKDDEYHIYLCPHTIEADIPEIDPVPAIVEALKEQKADIYRKAAQEAAEVDDRISKYLALTNEVPAQVVEIDDERI